MWFPGALSDNLDNIPHAFFFYIDFIPSYPIPSPPHYSISNVVSPISCYSTPTLCPPIVVPLYFPGGCDWSMLYTHIWRVGARKCRWERPCSICLSWSGLAHSRWSFLIPTPLAAVRRSVGTVRKGLHLSFLHPWGSAHQSIASIHSNWENPISVEGSSPCFSESSS